MFPRGGRGREGRYRFCLVLPGDGESWILRFGSEDGTEKFCGMGVTENSFDTPRFGIRAQVQHLKAYGSREELRNRKVFYKGRDGVNMRKTPCMGDNVNQVMFDGIYTVTGINGDGQ